MLVMQLIGGWNEGIGLEAIGTHGLDQSWTSLYEDWSLDIFAEKLCPQNSYKILKNTTTWVYKGISRNFLANDSKT